MNEPEFQIFIKPVGAECNLRCRYCYYLEKKNLSSEGSRIMNDATLEKYIKQHFEASSGEVISFSWHGGEPLLAGIDFYRKALMLQERYKPVNVQIINGIQTNGTLLDDTWCNFFSENGFAVGISLDGPRELHDVFRRNSDNKGTWHNVLQGYNLLTRYGIIPEILCTVNSVNGRNPLEIYSFFKNLGARFISFLPLVERKTGKPAEVTKRSVSSKEFGVFLRTIFDEWVQQDIGNIKIQIIEEAARIAFGQEHTLCIFRENCGKVPALEHNGDFYSCDHYVTPRFLLGNIHSSGVNDMLNSEDQLQFGLNKSLSLPEYCRRCEVLSMCNGECPKNRFIETPDGQPGLNYLCAGYKYFFNHCKPFVDAIGEAWRSGDDPGSACTI